MRGEQKVKERFEEHNEMVRKLWCDFESNKHERVPVLWSMNDRMIVLNKELNTSGYNYERIFNHPDVMMNVELQFEYWKRHNIWCDWELGLPEKWDLYLQFQNIYESAWLGARPYYTKDNVPDIMPFLKTEDDIKNFIKMGTPDPFSGFMTKVKRFYEYFLEQRERGFTYVDRPIGKISAPIGTDGPFSIATNISGGYIIKLLYLNPSLAEEFLWFVTDALIERMKAWHKLLKVDFPYGGFSFADDSIQLLSPSLYSRFVLPLHKKIIKTFCAGRPGIHLCGTVTQHLKILKDELKIRSIDTGFPLDLGEAREILGEDVLVRGNLHVMTLLRGPKEKIKKETIKILNSGVMKGKRYIFGEGNNVAPNTPMENLNYAYDLVREIGTYDE